jgi:hypothetical protein
MPAVPLTVVTHRPMQISARPRYPCSDHRKLPSECTGDFSPGHSNRHEKRPMKGRFSVPGEEGCCGAVSPQLMPSRSATDLICREGGITGYLPVPCPSGSLRQAQPRAKSLPAILSNPRTLRVRSFSPGRSNRPEKTPREGALFRAWRRGRDSNPRTSCLVNSFQDCRIRPLCHLSRDSAGAPGGAQDNEISYR